MKEEILYGIKMAMQRGTSLEQAAQSFINAGYNEKEVREAAKMLSGGVTEIVEGKLPEINNAELPSLPQVKNSKKRTLIIIILALGAVFLGIVGSLIYYLLMN